MGLLRRFLGGPSPPSNDALQRAHVLFDSGRYDDAAAAYAVIAHHSPSPGTLVNLGYAQLMGARLAEAQEAFGRAMALNEKFPPAWVGLGDLAAARMDHAGAIARYEHALSLDPMLTVAHNNLAQSLQAVGRLEESWQEAEWRYQAPGASTLYPHRYPLLRWDGTGNVGRLLVHWEQGLGDMLQHVRFLHVLVQRGIDFRFECPPPLFRLLEQSVGEPHVFEARDSPADCAEFTHVCGLLSLPALLRIPGGQLPIPPYLSPWCGGTRERDTLRLSMLSGARELIGVVWRGSQFDVSRNASVSSFAALSAPHRQLVSLQTDPTESEMAELVAMGGIDVSSRLGDFLATAQIVDAMDGVVSVDTAVAHLTGALGRPLKLLLNERCAVRWMLGRRDSPWYPSARLFRKREADSWSSCLVRVSAELAGRESLD